MENVNKLWHGSMWMGMEVGKWENVSYYDWSGDYQSFLKKIYNSTICLQITEIQIKYIGLHLLINA